MPNNIAVYIGIDWSDRKHDFCLKVEGNDKMEKGVIQHKPEAIHAWICGLEKRFPGKKIAIALEQFRGGLVFCLMKYESIILYPVNPETLSKYREAWSPSRAKNDPADAMLLMEILVKHSDRIKAWKPEPENTRLLQRLTEQRQKLVHDIKRAGNRLTSLLKEYFPQVLDLFPVIYRNVVADFVIQYPTLEDAKKASQAELINFFKSKSSVNVKANIKRFNTIKNAMPLTNDKAILSSNILMAKAIAEQIKALNTSIAIFENEIYRIYQLHQDKRIFDSLPAAGEVMAPRLLAALGTDRSKFDSSNELLCFSGVAPILKSSGTQSVTRWRYFCSTVIRQSFIDWANISRRYSFWAETYYANQRSKGKSHSVAVRALAYKWIRIIFRMWKDNTTYDEAKYLMALKASGSYIFKKAVA